MRVRSEELNRQFQHNSHITVLIENLKNLGIRFEKAIPQTEEAKVIPKFKSAETDFYGNPKE